ncbi:hypothetical protein PROFUN_08941 [Planoprotostelium fungivorum]|uniref:Uncharacterized protein n=1 Tax=Planoprotostelium fungivorum TaxID=1890364 RepID=A0A2P6NIP8_9EUKA|nr:hypothetical protein PROFUN_08941 [Planoprotostelium fungivorum]
MAAANNAFLMSDIQARLKSLEEKLDRESAERQKLARQLSGHSHADDRSSSNNGGISESQIKAIKREVLNEVLEKLEEGENNHAKIVQWIKDKLGPNLEKVENMIDQKIDKKLSVKSLINPPPSINPKPPTKTEPAPERVSVFARAESNLGDSKFKFLETKPQTSTREYCFVHLQRVIVTEQSSKSAPDTSAQNIEPIQFRLPTQDVKTSQPASRSGSRSNSVSNFVPNPSPAPVVNPEDPSNRRQAIQAKQMEKSSADPVKKSEHSAVKAYVSDEEWSDSDEENRESTITSKRTELRQALAKVNRILVVMEDKAVPKPLPYRFIHDERALRAGTSGITAKLDAYHIPSTAKLNLEHSQNIMESVYRVSPIRLMDDIRMMNERGVRVIFAPPSVREQPFVFGIRQTDHLLPICTDGLGRSQVLHLVFKGLKRSLGTETGVYPPHGAVYGFDAPKDIAELDSGIELDELVKFTTGQDDSTTAAFRATFGQDKQPRAGQKEARNLKSANWKKDPDSVLEMTNYFDIFYYKIAEHHQKLKKSNAKATTDAEVTPRHKYSCPLTPEQVPRVIFAVFGASFRLVMRRILQVNSRDRVMDNVVILVLPYRDEAGLLASRVKTNETEISLALTSMYKQYSTLFMPIL